MTIETYDNLSNTIGRHFNNKEWVVLIAENFNVSNSVAKAMLHSMMSTKKILTGHNYESWDY